MWPAWGGSRSTAARDRSPEVQRLFAALDQGGGHAHIRHEGWVTEEMNELREALSDLERLPDDEVFKAVDYGDGSDERVLRRVEAGGEGGGRGRGGQGPGRRRAGTGRAASGAR